MTDGQTEPPFYSNSALSVIVRRALVKLNDLTLYRAVWNQEVKESLANLSETADDQRENVAGVRVDTKPNHNVVYVYRFIIIIILMSTGTSFPGA